MVCSTNIALVVDSNTVNHQYQMDLKNGGVSTRILHLQGQKMTNEKFLKCRNPTWSTSDHITPMWRHANTHHLITSECCFPTKLLPSVPWWELVGAEQHHNLKNLCVSVNSVHNSSTRHVSMSPMSRHVCCTLSASLSHLVGSSPDRLSQIKQAAVKTCHF